MNRELDAAGITEPALRASYTRCRELNAVHGRTYFLATRLLPPAARPAIHALYGLARYADEIVDDLADTRPWPQRLAELDTLAQQLRDGLARGSSNHPVLAAPVHTAIRYRIDPQHFTDFMASMRMDRPVEQGGVAGYQTFDELGRYVHGSAAVIGLQMLPILEPVAPEAGARARALGEAFQMSNFIRDVGEDLKRGRVYLPQEDLDTFGVNREILERGVVTPSVRELLRFEIERTRALYAFAEPGIDMLHPTSRDCVRTAFTLYRGILDAVEAAHYQVLTQRVSVPLTRRLAVALPAARHAHSVRREQERWVRVA